MPKVYLWRNRETGEVRETDTHETPPDESGDWQRAYVLGIGKVPGGAGDKARQINQEKKRGTGH